MPVIKEYLDELCVARQIKIPRQAGALHANEQPGAAYDAPLLDKRFILELCHSDVRVAMPRELSGKICHVEQMV